jgi:hypothetical protein
VGFFFAQGAGAPFFVLPKTGDFAVIVLHALFVVAETAVLIYLAARLKSLFMESEHAAAFAARVKTGRLDYAFTAEMATRCLALDDAALADLQAVLRADLLSFKGRRKARLKVLLRPAEAANTVVAVLQRQAAATVEGGGIGRGALGLIHNNGRERPRHSRKIAGCRGAFPARQKPSPDSGEETADFAREAAQAAVLVRNSKPEAGR